jgi:hypothetical protein
MVRISSWVGVVASPCGILSDGSTRPSMSITSTLVSGSPGQAGYVVSSTTGPNCVPFISVSYVPSSKPLTT